MKGIIYKWTCLKSGKSYIGQTINEERREKEFFSKSEPYTKENSKIDNARKKYGLSKDMWKKEVLKRLWCKDGKESELLERLNYWERYYIKEYDTFNNGYNSTDGGGHDFLVTKEVKEKCKVWLGKNRYSETNENIRKKQTGKKKSDETKEKIKNSVLNSVNCKNQFKPVKQFTLDGKFIMEYGSISEASMNTGINFDTISGCARGLIRNPRKFIWKFFNEEDVISNKNNNGYYFYRRLNKYRARLRHGGKEYSLGFFWNERSASEMYKYACENKDNIDEWFKDIEKHKKYIMDKYGN